MNSVNLGEAFPLLQSLQRYYKFCVFSIVAQNSILLPHAFESVYGLERQLISPGSRTDIAFQQYQRPPRGFVEEVEAILIKNESSCACRAWEAVSK